MDQLHSSLLSPNTVDMTASSLLFSPSCPHFFVSPRGQCRCVFWSVHYSMLYGVHIITLLSLLVKEEWIERGSEQVSTSWVSWPVPSKAQGEQWREPQQQKTALAAHDVTVCSCQKCCCQWSVCICLPLPLPTFWMLVCLIMSFHFNSATCSSLSPYCNYKHHLSVLISSLYHAPSCAPRTSMLQIIPRSAGQRFRILATLCCFLFLFLFPSLSLFLLHRNCSMSVTHSYVRKLVI